MLLKIGVNQVSIPVVMSQPLDVLPRTWTFRLFTGGPVEGERLVSYPWPRDVWGASPSLKKYKVHQNEPF